MNNKNELTRITADIPKKSHIKLKSIAMLTGKSMKEVIVEAIDAMDINCMTSSHSPNENTLQSLKNIEARENLTEIGDLKDLFKKLGI